MSPDPGAFHFENPQSLNRYAYALNNPLFYVDLDGADSVSAIYRLGTATVTTFFPTGQSLDPSSFLASVQGGFQHLALKDLQQSQPMATPRELDTGGGCSLVGCVSLFSEVPVGIELSLAFNYDPKTNALIGVSIEFSINPNASFLTPDPRPGRAAVVGLPGMTPRAEISAVYIDPNALRKLSSAQLGALIRATNGKKDPINRAINEAALAEQRRRDEEARKKAEEEEKKKRKGS